MTNAANDIFWVISNYQQDPSEVVESLNGEYHIFNQGESSFIPHEMIESGRVSNSLHSGHNLSDYLEYIIQNYYSLPARVGFIKGNFFLDTFQKRYFLSVKGLLGLSLCTVMKRHFSPNLNFICPCFILRSRLHPATILK